MYLGTAIALLFIEVVAGVWSELVEFRDNVNLTIHPAQMETVEVMTQQRRAGRSLADAAAFTVEHIGRGSVRLTVYDEENHRVYGDAASPGAAEALAAGALALLDTPTLEAAVPGGR